MVKTTGFRWKKRPNLDGSKIRWPRLESLGTKDFEQKYL